MSQLQQWKVNIITSIRKKVQTEKPTNEQAKQTNCMCCTYTDEIKLQHNNKKTNNFLPL